MQLEQGREVVRPPVGDSHFVAQEVLSVPAPITTGERRGERQRSEAVRPECLDRTGVGGERSTGVEPKLAALVLEREEGEPSCWTEHHHRSFMELVRGMG